MSRRVLKIVADKWGAASRDRKELAICKEFGADIIVMQKGATKDKGHMEVLHGFDVYNYSTRPLGDVRILRGLNKFISLFTWAHHARRFNADIITGHDYIGLFIGWLSTMFIPKKKRPALVYDSHEYELGRVGRNGKLRKFFVRLIEGFLIRRCAFTIIPSSTIANMLSDTYKVKLPIVSRNIPLYWQLDADTIAKNRVALREKLGLPHDEFVMMYHGVVAQGRSIEPLIRVVKMTGVPLIVLGNCESQTYYSSLKQYACELGVGARVLFMPAVPQEELWKIIGAVDVGMITITAYCESYYHMLPNKLFENIQSLTPIITSNYPDISEIVNGYDIGLTTDPSDDSSIADAVMKMRDDKELYSRLKANLTKAKNELCWENERQPLYDAYKELFK